MRVLCVLCLFLAVIVQQSSAREVPAGEGTFHLIDNVEFGLSGGEGWFRFLTETGEELKFLGLKHMDNLFVGGEISSTTYVKRHKDANWISMTILSSDLVSITIHKNGEVLTVGPADEYNRFRTQGTARRLKSTSHVLSYSRTHWPSNSSCISKGKPNTKSFDLNQESPNLNVNDHTVQHASTNRRRQLQERAERWESCYPGQDTARYLDIGIVADYGFYQDYSSNVTRVLKAIEIVLANTNLVYYYQFNIFLRVRQVLVVTSDEDDDESVLTFEDIFRQSPTTSCFDIDLGLAAMNILSTDLSEQEIVSLMPTTDIADPQLAQLAHWHLLTVCHESGTVGVAFVETLCDTTRYSGIDYVSGTALANVGVSSRVFDGITWLTFAHEMGHAFGADHSFEEGQGSTGGIMDYGDGIYEGIFQFNEQYRRSDFCGALTSIRNQDLCQISPTINWFPEVSSEPCVSSESTCFNGAGLCIDSSCHVAEILLRVDSAGVETFASYVEAPFSASTVDSIDGVIHGYVHLASPQSGCEFSDEVNGKIVIVNDRTNICGYETKTQNAIDGGAIAVVVWSRDNSIFAITITTGYKSTIPVVMITDDDGDLISAALTNTSYANLGLVVRASNLVDSENAPGGTEPPFSCCGPVNEVALAVSLSVLSVLAASIGAFFYIKRRQQANVLSNGRQNFWTNNTREGISA